MLRNTIDSLEYTIKSCDNLLSKEDVLRERGIEIDTELNKKKEYTIFLKGAKEKYSKHQHDSRSFRCLNDPFFPGQLIITIIPHCSILPPTS